MDIPKEMTENELRVDLWFLVVKYAKSQGVNSGDDWIYPLIDRLTKDIMESV